MKPRLLFGALAAFLLTAPGPPTTEPLIEFRTGEGTVATLTLKVLLLGSLFTEPVVIECCALNPMPAEALFVRDGVEWGPAGFEDSRLVWNLAQGYEVTESTIHLFGAYAEDSNDGILGGETGFRITIPFVVTRKARIKVARLGEPVQLAGLGLPPEANIYDDPRDFDLPSGPVTSSILRPGWYTAHVETQDDFDTIIEMWAIPSGGQR